MPNIDEATRDKTSPVWDMSQERVFIENLTNQRFNFFLVVFAFIIAGTINARSYFTLLFILTFGSIVCTFLIFAILRINKKLSIILNHIKEDATHPITIIDKKAGGKSVRWITGKALPIFCTCVLWLFLLLAIFKKDIFTSPNNKSEMGFKIYNSDSSLCDTLKLVIDK